jgi:hypothetical protein
LGQFGDSEGSVLLRSSGGQGSETHHEEVETRERDQVDSQLSEVRVQLTRETEAASDTGHSGGDQVVQVTIGRGSELQGSEADIVQGFVVDDHAFVGVFDQLMDGQSGVVRFHDGVRHLGGGDHGEGFHDSVGIFFSDLGDQEGTHTGTGTTTQGVGDLESLEAVAAFGFLSHDIEDGVDEFGTFSVVTLGPVVTGTSLSEHEVVGAEELTEGSGTDGVHGTGFQVHEDGSGHITATSGFVIVNVDSFQLEVRIAMVSSGGVNSVFVGDDFPEFGTDLVTALSALYMYDFTHI